MAIQPIQNLNTKSTQPSFKKKEKEVSPYIGANETIKTDNNVKPLPAEGHLIHDDFGNGVKYFFKDMAYDAKAVKDGFTGNANDHQLGRLNDVGLKLGGIGIATYLASRTSDPKTRLMEYVGLGTFLAAMSIYPKIAINKPAELVHGFEIDKEYIDDQGRKKSVFQDSNYIPYDMYRSEFKSEDLDEIGDRMGIPRDVHNRHAIIKEQMRKIATQNNTLWMLTAGLATPAMTALTCSALEYPIGIAVEKTRNAKYNGQIRNMLTKTGAMSESVASVKPNDLSRRVDRLLIGYKGQELPANEFDNVINVITVNLDTNIADGIKEDVTRILKTAHSGGESIVINKETVDEMLNGFKNAIKGRNRSQLEAVLVPTREELSTIIANQFGKDGGINGVTVSAEKMNELKTRVDELITGKIHATSDIPKDFLETQKANVLSSLDKTAKSRPSIMVTEESFKEIVDFSKVIGEFKENREILDRCKNFKVEANQNTILARYYNKFESTFLSELGITQKEMKKMKESEEFTKEILDRKLTELCKNEKKYEKTVKKLGNIMSDMDVALNGKNETESVMKDLVTAIENNYNKTAKRLNTFDGKFSSTINRLVKEDVSTLGNSLTSRSDLFDMLDGIRPSALQGKSGEEYIRLSSKGVGSAKNLEISKITDRYAGVKNSFNRVVHTMDFYKRGLNPELINGDVQYAEMLIKDGKEALLNATTTDHTMKLNMVNNPEHYKEVMNSVWKSSDEAFEVATKQKGLMSEATKKALEGNNSMQKGNIADRFTYYITRFKNLIANNPTDFTKPKHILNEGVRDVYEPMAKTNTALFNLVAKSPVDMAKEGAGKKFLTNKWLRIMGAFTAVVFSGTILTQFTFGKIRNPQNMKKQVENETK